MRQGSRVCKVRPVWRAQITHDLYTQQESDQRLGSDSTRNPDLKKQVGSLDAEANMLRYDGIRWPKSVMLQVGGVGLRLHRATCNMKWCPSGDCMDPTKTFPMSCGFGVCILLAYPGMMPLVAVKSIAI